MSTHLLPTALVGRYTAGMPQLSSSGLSENWLILVNWIVVFRGIVRVAHRSFWMAIIR